MPNKNGLILVKPSTVDKTGTGSTATISANGSVEFSSCATLSLNGVFSADYDNYMVVIRHNTDSGAGPAVYVRLRSSGANATTNYAWQYVYATSTSVTGLRNTTEGYGRIGQSSGTQRSGLVAWFYGPHLAQPTAFRNICVSGQDNANLIDYANTHSTSSSYDGFTFQSSAAGTIMSGRVAVYGMRN